MKAGIRVLIWWLGLFGVIQGHSDRAIVSDPPRAMGNILYFSTMDGQITALDVDRKGTQLWSLHTDKRPLLSGTLSDLELYSPNNEPYRLIPSLDGNLYMYGDGFLRPVPISANSLLDSSLKFGADVVAGGRYVLTYGIEPSTGEVKYFCSADGCDTHIKSDGDTLVVKRTTQVVRAVSANDGTESWNLTVGEHKMAVVNPSCGRTVPRDRNSVKFHIHPPDGYITAIDSNTEEVLWYREAGTPIAQLWQLNNGNLEEISLFNTDIVPALSAKQGSKNTGMADDIWTGTTLANIESLLYFGSFNNELYVIPSDVERQKFNSLQAHLALAAEDSRVGSRALVPRNEGRLSLRGTPAEDYLLLLRHQRPSDPTPYSENVCQTEQASSIGLQTVSERNRGWYLYKHKMPNSMKKLTGPWHPRIDGPNTLDEVLLPTFWPVLTLTLLLALGTTLMIAYQCHKSHQLPITLRSRACSSTETRASLSDSTSTSHLSLGGVVSDGSNLSSEVEPSTFSSRFVTDFDYVRTMGKGGFGVVFEVTNKFDGCQYAIKRITVQDSKKAKEKVMREVKSLAALDHPGIIRYFQSWLETPPPEWKLPIDDPENDESSKCIFSATVSAESHSDIKNNNIRTDPQRSICSENEQSSSFSEELPFNSILRRRGRHNTLISPTTNTNPNESVSIVFESSNAGEDSQHPRQVSATKSQSKEEQETVVQRVESISRSYLYIQMQLCKDATLSDWLQSTKVRDEKLVSNWFIQITEALAYVHELGIIHRDLKPSNIFFASNDRLKIGDFGLAVTVLENLPPAENRQQDKDKMPVDKRHTSLVGTSLYMSPEQLGGSRYTYKVDMYSMGIILAEMLLPFDTGMERIRVLTDLRRGSFDSVPTTSIVRKSDLIRRLIDKSPDKRPSCQDIITLSSQIEAFISCDNLKEFREN